jgi:hypothetical protein
MLVPFHTCRYYCTIRRIRQAFIEVKDSHFLICNHESLRHSYCHRRGTTHDVWHLLTRPTVTNSDRGLCPRVSTCPWIPKVCQVSWNLQRITRAKRQFTNSLLISHRLLNPNAFCHLASALVQLMCSCLSYMCWQRTHGGLTADYTTSPRDTPH